MWRRLRRPRTTKANGVGIAVEGWTRTVGIEGGEGRMWTALEWVWSRRWWRTTAPALILEDERSGIWILGFFCSLFFFWIGFGSCGPTCVAKPSSIYSLIYWFTPHGSFQIAGPIANQTLLPTLHLWFCCWNSFSSPFSLKNNCRPKPPIVSAPFEILLGIKGK